jgi:hypothetical protein
MALLVSRMNGQDDLLTRPRVSHKISEYIVEFIDVNILVPLKIMQGGKFDFELTLDFDKFLPDRHKINSVSPYTTHNKKFITPNRFRTVDKIIKWAYLSVCTTTLDENIRPKEYALLAYELVGSFLIKNFKKITKDILDKHQENLDFNYIESFPFPASFEDQKYSLDESTYSKGMVPGNTRKEELIWIVPSVEYKKHYGF